MFRSIVFIFVLLFSPFLARSAIPILSVDNSSNLDQGIVKLNWEHPHSGSQEFELQQSTDADFSSFTSVYKGSDLATFISGLDNGTYFYRVLHLPSLSFSETISIEVEHHPLSLAFVMLGLGASVFVLTMIVLIRGARQQVAIK